jgi:hypothetical protein
VLEGSIGTHRTHREPFDQAVGARVGHQFRAQFLGQVGDGDPGEFPLPWNDPGDRDRPALEKRRGVAVQFVEVRVLDAVEHDALEPVTEAVGGPGKGVKAIRVEVALAEREFVRKIGVAFVREDNGGLAAVDLARIGGEDAGNAADSRSEIDTIPAVQRERGALHKGKHFSGARGGGNG